MNKAGLAGGRRINKKKRRKTITKGDMNYRKRINEVNTLIIGMKDNKYLLFRDYFTKILDEMVNKLTRKDFKDRDKFREFKENKLGFIFKILFTPHNQIKIILKTDNFKSFSKIFSNDVRKLFVIDLSDVVKNVINNEKFIVKDNKKEFNRVIFFEQCKTLEIDTSKKIPFSIVKKKYNEKLDEYKNNDEELENINKAFIIIRNQFENYLISTQKTFLEVI
tara:strand:+ start:1502 stop:2164 length:663 start_codon:yes stop_codon:yes gene_type:complete